MCVSVSAAITAWVDVVTALGAVVSGMAVTARGSETRTKQETGVQSNK